jgi:predicted permease
MMLSMTSVLLDCRLALRFLARRPGMAAVAIGSLALGIGASASVFGLVDALLFRPFPVHRMEELVAVRAEKEGELGGLSVPDFRDLGDSEQVFSALAAHESFEFSVRTGGSTERLSGELVSEEYFEVLGVAPAPGRGFVSGEDGAPAPVAVISHRLWQTRYGADPRVVGRAIRVNGRDLEIVGVAPEGFRGITITPELDLWIPLSMLPDLWPAFVEFFYRRDQQALSVIGRLKPGVSLEEANAAVAGSARALEQAYPETNAGKSARAVRFTETRLSDRGSVVSYLGVVLGVVASVFLLSCINVAGLRLLDLYSRETEIAVRRSLGASPWRIWRQFFVENLVVYLLGFVLALFVAAIGIGLLERMSLFRMALSEVDLRLDLRVAAVASGLTLVGAVLSSLVPLVASLRVDLPGRAGRSARLAPGNTRLRSALVAAQVMLSVALLVGAGLLLRTLHEVYAIDPGFRTERVLFVSVDLQSLEFRYDEPRARGFYREALERVRALPGVVSAAWSGDTPFERFNLITMFVPEEAASSEPPDWIQSGADIVSPGYFRTMGIGLVRGRDFAPTDDVEAPGVVVVNETMASKYWPGADAIGKRIRVWSRRGIHHDFYEVVGIVRDVKYRTLWEEPQPYLHFPLEQRFFQRMNLHVLTEAQPMTMLPAVREIIRSLDDDLPLFDARPLAEERAILLVRQRSVAMLLGASALLALMLVAVGTYAATAHHVALRIPEVGLRIALGAERADILRFVLRAGAPPVVFGVGLALVLSPWVGRSLESLLIGVRATDPGALLAAPLLSLATASAAWWFPARRASRVDPAQALRGE